jgi:hypothetical protein
MTSSPKSADDRLRDAGDHSAEASDVNDKRQPPEPARAASIVILKRSVSLPKSIWRLPSTRRTLPPLTRLQSLLETALHEWAAEDKSPALIEGEISEDGLSVTPRRPRGLKHQDSAGVFDLVTTNDQVKLRLSQEACRREVYTPRRSPQYIATLRMWEPIRVIINGKADWHSDRYYYLQDYHVILCDRPRGESLLAVRTFDFQADLI